MQSDTDQVHEDVLNQGDNRKEEPAETSTGKPEPQSDPEAGAEDTASAKPAADEHPPDPAPDTPQYPQVSTPPALPAPELPNQPAAAPKEPPAEVAANPVEASDPPAQSDDSSTAAAPAVAAVPAQSTVAAQSAAPESPGATMPGLPDVSTGAEDEIDNESIDFEDLDETLSPATPEIRPGTRRAGRIVSIEENGILVAFGAKIEGLVPLDDFRDAEGNIAVQPNQEIEVIFERFGEHGEYAVLSYHDSAQDEAWRKIEAASETQTPIEAQVEARVKGGLRVNIGVQAFLPGSQVDVRPIHDLEPLIGQTIQVLVVKVNRRRANVVVSRREMLAAEIKALKQETIAKLKEGEPITGRIKNITSYGVFVDLGGIDGLIHLTDISYGRVKDPSEILKPGSEVTARVLRFDAEKERVSLSIKHMQPDPWEGIEQRYTNGDRIKGRVASITDYGVFVELEPDVEGLIHITEMTWSRRLRHPSKVVKVGEEVAGVVLKVSPEDRRISLSLKQMNPDPWESLGEEFQVGKIVEGRVRNVTTYGAFVEVREGIDGLVHVSDLTWESRVKNPKELVRKGQQLKTVILHVDQKNRRLSLGVKQLEPDAWDSFFSKNTIGDKVPGLVTRLAKFGAFVEVAPGVEGLCHNSQIPRKTRHGGQALQIDKHYLFEILRINELDRKIGLRCENTEPLAAEPEVEQPKVVGPKVEEPQVEEPKAEEPQVEEPQAEESQVEEPQVEEPQVVEAQAEEPQAEEPKVEEPETETQQAVESSVPEENATKSDGAQDA